MTEPQQPRPLPLEDALAQVAPRWDDARSQETLPGARAKLVARGRRRALASGAVAALLLASGASWLLDLGPEVPVTAPGYVITPQGVRFEDGSRALLLDESARVVVSAVSSAAIDVGLRSGRARFEISKRAERRFRVDCGEVTVEVLGTVFELARAGARTHVRVTEGRVAVRWASGETRLAAGDEGFFPPLSGDAAGDDAAGEPERTSLDPSVPAATGERAKEAPSLPSSSATRPKNGASWRQHAEQGDFGRAYALLAHDDVRVADDVEELLLAADAARLSGHPAQALPYLDKVVERHARDPRASLAAFTLGGVLLNQLGRPREAESAYGRARTLSPSSSLAQDALARQVEAAHRAGDQDRARVLAGEYEDRYPSGRRLNAVRRFGGLP